MGERIRLSQEKPGARVNHKTVGLNKTKSQSNQSPVDRILNLQRTIGNQAVTRLIRSGVLQASLKIGQPGDIYEKEADRVAEQVMRMPEQAIQRQVEEEEEEKIQTKPLAEQITPLVQRQAVPEEEEEPVQAKLTNDSLLQRQVEEEEEEQIQAKLMENQQLQRQEEEEEEISRKASGNPAAVSSDIESRIQSMKSGGQPLSESTRAFFEPRFGVDFSQVRVHTGSGAAETAQAINARAFTTGKDIVFGSGQYSPGTSSGKRLLAHELTHVAQQGKSNPNTVRSKGKFPSITPNPTNTPIVSRMKITPIGTSPKSNCGSYRYRWKFELDNNAPCDGFMVQQVDIHEVKKDCSKPAVNYSLIKPNETFWESWRINKGDKVDVDFSKYGYSDQFSEGSKPNSTGTHSDVGHIKFFCKSTTGDLDKNWTPNKYSGGLPATTSKPSWWGNKSIDTGSHFASAWWNCCGDRTKWWSKINAMP